MATKITWENKEGIQNDESIPRKNKVMDDDMNEIKQAVNNNADELNEAQENINNLQDGQGTANVDITSLKNRVTTLETDNTQNKSDINTLKNDNETNKSNIQQLQNKQQETETNIETLQEKVNTLETDNTQNKADISTLKSDNTTNKENISTLQEQVSNKVDKVEGKGLSTNDYTTEEKQKLAGLQNYDDTEIKQNIADIKEEQENQNEKIETNTTKNEEQDELISKLKSALINVETEEAKSLHIEDASTVPAQLSVAGNQEQETREGYNMLNSSLFDLSEVSDYATFNSDGTITFNGTVNADINIRSLRKQVIQGTGKENIVIKTLSGSLNGTLRLVAQDTEYGNIKYSQIGTSSFSDKLTENIEYNIFSITITSGTVMNNLKLGFMIVNDSDLNKEYEQYGAMPSPDYPSEVVCLGSNKNEIGLQEIQETTTNGITYKVENEKIYLSGVSTMPSFIDISLKEEINLNNKKVFRAILENIIENNNKVSLWLSNNENENLVGNLWLTTLDNVLKTTELDKTATKIRIYVGEADITFNTEIKTKLEKGEIQTAYSPHNQGSTKISKINENLFDEIFRYGSNSVEAGNTFTFNKNNISCRKETEYIFSTNLDTSIYKYGIFINKEKFPNNNESEYNSGWIVDNLKKFNPTIDGYIGIQITRRDGTSFSLEDLSNYWFLLKIGNTSTDYIKHQQTDYILPIQQEMLTGDYFVKEEDGWKEVHNWTKIDSYNSESITTDYISTTGELTTGATIYYKLATPTKLPCTEEQSAVLDELNNLNLFDGVNNIITAENIALLQAIYTANAQKYVDKEISDIKEQLNTINELLSTTGTSSLLLDNLQSDLESEVM